MYQDKTDTTFAGIRDVHYGHLAHQTIAWSVGFASLELLINYCDDEYNARTAPNYNNNTAVNGNETVTGTETNTITKDDTRKNKLFLPPPLTRDLLLENATAEFDAALDVAHQSFIDNNCNSSGSSSSILEEDQSPCMISWISTPGNYNANAINRFMKTYTTVINGWEAEKNSAEGWSNKDGWIATKAGASFTLQFKNIQKNVKTVTLYFLRSYGDKWKDSNAKFTISRLKENTDDNGSNNATDAKEDVTTILSEEEIAGVHADEDYKYSLTLSQTISLSDVVLKGETLNIEAELISGSHFKIMGMMICNK